MPTRTFYDYGMQGCIPMKSKGDAGVEWLRQCLPATAKHHTVSRAEWCWKYTRCCNFSGIEHYHLLAQHTAVFLLKRSKNATSAKPNIAICRVFILGLNHVPDDGNGFVDLHKALVMGGHVAKLNLALGKLIGTKDDNMGCT